MRRTRALSCVLVMSCALLGACATLGGSSGGLRYKSKDKGEGAIEVKSAIAYEERQNRTFNIGIADYEMKPGRVLEAVPEGQKRVTLYISRTDETPVQAGQVYKMPIDGHYQIGSGLDLGKTREAVELANGTLPTGTIKITSIDDTTISGDVDVTNGQTSIKGPFSATIVHRDRK